MNDRDHDKQTVRRFQELARRAEMIGTYTYSSFHSPEGAALAYQAAGERQLRFFGGANSCERVMIRFGDPEEMGYEEEFPIGILCAEPTQPKFAENLTHRDFLGAVLNLGIERDVIGDILIKDSRAYIFVQKDMEDYVLSALERVRHTTVKCYKVFEVPEDYLPELKEESVTVVSPRLDAVLAKVYRLSRTEAKALFDSEKVTVNGHICRNPEFIPKENSRITVRGYGRLEYKGEEHATKKGKIAVNLMRYV